MMSLKNFSKTYAGAQWLGGTDCTVGHIAYHAGHVTPGSCFVAIRGFKNDGHHYIGEAIARGASAVITEKEMPVPPTVAQMVVYDSRDALARLSCAFFEEPSREMALIGITGTNGKTTVAYLLESIWEAAGLKSGVISTVDYRYGKTLEATHTTPESWPLQKMLREMVDSQVTHCVMEVTSHAIDLKRVVGCHFDGA